MEQPQQSTMPRCWFHRTGEPPYLETRVLRCVRNTEDGLPTTPPQATHAVCPERVTPRAHSGRMRSSRAYIDESIRTAAGLYLFGAVCIEPSSEVPVRDALLGALPSGSSRFHWRNDSRLHRLVILHLLVELPATSIVLFQAGIDPRKAERHRQHLLWNLAAILDRELGVNDLVFESREKSQNAKDSQTLTSISQAGIAGPDFRYTFARPLDEPLLWLPDTVAGACGESIANRGDKVTELCDQAVAAVIEVPPRS